MHRWLKGFARFGILTHGVVYTVVGLLALAAACNLGGAIEGSPGALAAIGQQPFGRVMLGIVAVGLTSFAAWRLVQAVADPDRAGKDLHGILTRFGYVVTGVTYLGFAWLAAGAALGSSAASHSEQSQREWTARLLAQPWGAWLVGTFGAIVMGVGISQFYQAVRASFMEEYRLASMGETRRRLAKRFGQLSFAAFGVTFLIIGGFFVHAAITADPSETKGIGGALRTLEQQPYGPWLLGVVAAGFIAFGGYSFLRARYRRFAPA